MRRRHLFEIHDHPACPTWLRDLVTDALETIWRQGDFYRPILPLLWQALDRQHPAGAGFVDLCSGGGGPWPRLQTQLGDVQIVLTDRNPNAEAARRAEGRSIRYVADSVDATQVPPHLRGFRTIFSSFHHFPPAMARRILADAAAGGQGIGVFEAARRRPLTLLLVAWAPLMALRATLGMRPVRWSRLFWTYLVPLVPFAIWFDGVVSCLRAYTPAEMLALTKDLDGLDWQAGEAGGRFGPITYLVGLPRNAVTEQ